MRKMMDQGRELDQAVHQIKTVWSMCKDAADRCMKAGLESQDLAFILRLPQETVDTILKSWGLG